MALCPLCERKRARRNCPALGREICPTCCGTKRLVEIRCPSNCTYLAASREHPAAAVVRRQERDLAWLASWVRDLSERQSKLFFLVSSFLARYAHGGGRHEVNPYTSTDEVGRYTPIDAVGPYAPTDEDAAEGLGALAATLETSARGVIYEHRPASIPAERLAAALKPLLNEFGKGGGSAFERDAAVVLRQIEQAARGFAVGHDRGRRAFLELLDRVIVQPAARSAEPDAGPPADGPRLILP